MKKRKVWRYTCDFCKKSNCSGGSIASHELHCTKNPARVCRMCSRVGDTQRPIAELIAAIEYGPMPEFDDLTERRIEKLRAVAHNCPACVLGAIRQVNETECIHHEAGNFKFKDECAAWIADYRESCFGTNSGDQIFDRDEWNHVRERRYPMPAPQTASIDSRPLSVNP